MPVTEEAGDVVLQDGNGESGAVDGDGDDAEEEAERQRPIRDPGKPTKEMIDEHNISHIPFRPWCKACVGGKAENLVPRVRLDYAFLTEMAC